MKKRPHLPFLSLLIWAAASTVAVAADEAPKGLPAEVIKVAAEPIDITLEAVGTLRANEAVMIRPERTGRVLSIHFKEGQPVTQGQKLFTLAASTEQASLHQVEASRDLSKVEYEQAQQLLEKKLGSRHERDKAMAQLNIDEARVKLARTALDKMTLFAPFSGRAGLRLISEGDYVTDGQDLVALVDLETLKLDFKLPEKSLARLHIGQQVSVSTEALPEETFNGEIYAISPLIDEQSRSIALRARIHNAKQRLLPGLFTRVELRIDRLPQALMIPEQAIIPSANGFSVYRVTDGTIESAKVTLGVRRSGTVQITDGLKEGDVIVTAGQLKLRPGSPVTPVFPPDLANAAEPH